MKLIEKAILFAAKAHYGQKRKYTELPYIGHPLAVMDMVRVYFPREDVLAAAVLHDVVEDTPVTIKDIYDQFGPIVADMVDALTDKSRPEDGNRAVRKKIDRDSLAKASPVVKTIKLADLIDNSASIVKHDKGFARVYMAEKKDLLEVLGEGHPALYRQATEIIEDYYKKKI